MDRKKPGGAGPLLGGKGPDKPVIIILLGAQLIVALAIWMLMRSRHTMHAAVVHPGATDLASLHKEFADWKHRALAAGLEVHHIDLDRKASATATAGSHSAAGCSTAAASGAAAECMPNGHPVTTVAPLAPEYLMRPAAEVEAENPEFAALLAKYANDKREIMLGLTNGVMICQNATTCWWNGGNILGSFLTILERANITNHLIGTTDEESAVYLEKHNKDPATKFQINWFKPKVAIPKVQANTREANRVSSLKFSLLQTSLQLGYHTLITDMDLVYISNPFDALHRDADIESSSDGFDEMAYGTMSSIHDETMGWGGGGLFMQTFTINVGCAYIRATHRAFAVVKRAADHLAAEPGWDQQVFNQQLLTQSHGDYSAPYATLRIMAIDQFVNSKTFFRSHRASYIPGASAKGPTPVLVHFNYHPDKHKRMLCIMDRYFYGKLDACDQFPGGSEPGS